MPNVNDARNTTFQTVNSLINDLFKPLPALNPAPNRQAADASTLAYWMTAVIAVSDSLKYGMSIGDECPALVFMLKEIAPHPFFMF